MQAGPGLNPPKAPSSFAQHRQPLLTFMYSLLDKVGHEVNDILARLENKFVWGRGLAPTCVVTFACAADVQHIMQSKFCSANVNMLQFKFCTAYSEDSLVKRRRQGIKRKRLEGDGRV